MADQNIPVTANGNVQIDCDNDNNDTNRYIQFTHDNGTELMRIQENGYVGIGTSSPSNKVHIANAGSSTYIASDVFCTTDNSSC